MAAESERTIAAKFAKGLLRVYPPALTMGKPREWTVLIGGIPVRCFKSQAEAFEWAAMIERGVARTIENALGEGLRTAYEDCAKILEDCAHMGPAEVAAFFRRLKGMTR